MRKQERRSHRQFSIFRSLGRGRTTLLLRCGGVERSPGPVAPAKKKQKKQKMGFLMVIHVNTRSLLRHLDDVAALIAAEHPHIIALSETWLDASVTDAEIHLLGYSLFRFDRYRCSGGIAVFCVNNVIRSLLNCGVILFLVLRSFGFLLPVVPFIHLLLLVAFIIPLVLHHSPSMVFAITL